MIFMAVAVTLTRSALLHTKGRAARRPAGARHGRGVGLGPLQGADLGIGPHGLRLAEFVQSPGTITATAAVVIRKEWPMRVKR
ncbi:hypothetical protein GCM10010339_83340 [Streptomyces alanosinicus]|uniref:Uncharacterized protein n=1 Tax=Streptomyces alanosinicus TaxID=68171 RepID=A0A918YSX9_9ACTN|nr:hypothetical protein GCM10010339_83340 [Streptomyces alanosinicus]